MRRSLKLSLFALVLLGLVGGSAAYFAAQKALTLTVDGESRTVHTYADTTAEVLADEGLTPAAHDVLLPGAQTHLVDGDTVVLNRARPLTLTVDGVQSEVYTTALSVDDALDQLGYRAQDLVVSANRSERLPLTGMDLSIDTPKKVTLTVDGDKQKLSTTAATTGALLAEQGITLSADDRTNLDLDESLGDGDKVRVYRVTVTEKTVTEKIDYDTVTTKDTDAYKGTEKVTTAGVEGTEKVTYRVTKTDGKVTDKEELSSTVVTKPVDEEVTVGTKKKPALTASADGLNWTALAKCESGGNPKAVNPAGYYGLYQFSLSTWASVGGSGNPTDASSSEQTARAQKLYARGGAGQWGCGSHLYD